ncbi:cation-translocating P-type ATPase [Terrisporobacter petrolearius]|uniref:heavy metal translocating P-type ATPase n=1 Tax=Terrisporobacter petrolearius TaxID=1460447 RepID=UPI001D16E0B1|nr:cation-translocating P-type ATPase [Terrisporobacter petrolearius]MCC3865559.1 cation-translocating P-type ATPase [Terrisporobacter petrolearius]
MKNIFEDEIKRDILFLVISGIALIFSFSHIKLFNLDLAWISIIFCGIPIIKEAIEGLFTEFDIKADVLVSMALIASVIIGEVFAAGEVAFIMQIGAFLEEFTVKKSRKGIEKLVHLTPTLARVMANNEEKSINAKDVKVGDILRVNPGEVIPVDGVIIKGKTSIDNSIMSGESIPLDLSEGDSVYSGAVNQFGSFEMKATKVGEDSSIQRMIKLVESADASKAKIVGVADKWATYIVIAAFSSAILTWLVTGEIIRAVTILVVFCPCALVLATPTAIIAAIGNVSKHGILVKEGDALERLSKINKITFDKTGTLTYGKPKVEEVVSVIDNLSNEELYEIIASCELYSEHPLGRAIVASFKENHKMEIIPPHEFKIIPGRGVVAKLNNKKIIAGNKYLLLDEKFKRDEIRFIREKYKNKGKSIIYIGIDNKIGGYVILSDKLRDESKFMIKSIKNLGITPVLLTGDNKYVAQSIASQVNIEEVKSECFPQDKLEIIEDSQIKEKKLVCMVGDGINDAPALKKAFVGIAMGGVGSDIAVDAADIVLVRDDIDNLPHLLTLSKHMMKTIKINLAFSMGLNFVAVILAMTGMLGPVVGALVHNAGSVLVIINSALLLKYNNNSNKNEKYFKNETSRKNKELSCSSL